MGKSNGLSDGLSRTQTACNGSMYAIYMVTFTINIPQMLAYIPHLDPMGNGEPDIPGMSRLLGHADLGELQLAKGSFNVAAFQALLVVYCLRRKVGSESASLWVSIGLNGPISQMLSPKLIMPIGSMYAIYGDIYHQYTPNVSIYAIHGSYGIDRQDYRHSPCDSFHT